MTDAIKAFTMPKWGIEMEEGVIREWHADIGDAVNEGDLFVVIETDKIANDVELEYSATLRWRIAEEGDSYAVGALIAIFAEDSVSDEDVAAFRQNFKAVDARFAGSDTAEVQIDDTSQSEEPEVEEMSAPVAIPSDTTMSPLARKLAEDLNVDLSAVEGSGRRGRLSLQDVEQAAKTQGRIVENHTPHLSMSNTHQVIKLTAMRKTIAKRLTEANQNIPHFYLRTKINMDALLASRKHYKQGSVNDYVIKACAIALTQEPEVNVHFMGDSIHQYQHADVSVAVATDRGLITPIIRAANMKSITDISAEMKVLAQKAQAEKLAPSDYQGGTFSVSNLGMMGVTSFDAIINPPMGAILAVGASETVPTEGGGVTSVMNVTLSCDHRAIDGALGARWLQAFKSAMENPNSL
jgi:pyruvate dehydrogenase E2 component (dihydrolipoamide acetyltransferase)